MAITTQVIGIASRAVVTAHSEVAVIQFHMAHSPHATISTPITGARSCSVGVRKVSTPSSTHSTGVSTWAMTATMGNSAVSSWKKIAVRTPNSCINGPSTGINAWNAPIM